MGQVLLVTPYRVTLQRRRVGCVGRKAGDRLAGHGGGDRGRRRIGGAFEDVIGLGQLRGAPRKQRALRLLVDRHSGLVKHFHDVNTALAHCAGKRLAKDAVWTLFIPRQSARSCIESDQFARLRIDQRKSRRKRRPLRSIRVRAGSIEHDDAGFARRLRQRIGEVGNAKRIDRHGAVQRWSFAKNYCHRR